MKNLKRIFVFVLFAFAAVLAFGAINVKAAEAVAVEADFTTKAASHNSYTDAWTYGDWTVSGGANNAAQWEYIKVGGKNTNLAKWSDIYVAYKNAVTDQITKVTVNVVAGSLKKSGMTVNSWGVYVYSDAEMSNQIDYVAGGSITSAAQLFTFVPTSGTAWPANSYYKVKFDVSDTSGTNGIVCLDNISLYREVQAGLPQLTAPTVAVNGKVASWNAVNGTVLYKVGLYNAANAQSATYEVETTETSYDFSKFTSAGTWFVKVQAVADNTTSASSELSTNEVSFVNASEVTCTPTEFLSFTDPLGQTDYIVSGTLKAFYTNYAESNENNYSDQYSNVSFYLTDGVSKIIVYRLVDTKGKDLNVGDILTVKGKLQAYNSVNQIPSTGATYVSIKPLCGVGVQTADAGNGAQHVRLVGGLNVNYEDVTALTFTITDANDAQKTTTITVSNVFGTLTANGTAGVAEITAASQGFESLFALTITNIPAGTTLKVTATYTTAEGTYTSAVKTVEVPAAQ